jgi:8-oxo-dGTP diphosphatase
MVPEPDQTGHQAPPEGTSSGSRFPRVREATSGWARSGTPNGVEERASGSGSCSSGSGAAPTVSGSFLVVTRFQVVPAAYLLLTRGSGADLEVLLQLRGPATSYMAGHWATAAAGHVERGESVYAAAAREAAEELGIAVEPTDIEPLCAMQRTLPGVSDPVEQRVDYFLTTRAWRGEPSIQEPEKCVDLAWHRPASPPTPMVPHEAHLLFLLAGPDPVPPIVTFGF